MSEDLPDDGGIVEGGDQPQTAPTGRTCRHASTSIAKARCMSAAQLQARCLGCSPTPSGAGASAAALPNTFAGSSTVRP